MNAPFLRSQHEAGLTYEQYLQSGKPDQRANWERIGRSVTLSDAQRALVAAFTRRMNVIVLSGIWCGDCVQQGPLLQHIADANPDRVVMRWLDRDRHADLRDRVRINAGDRVPVVLFLAEDYELVGWYGDRTLARYRALAARQLAAACPLPGAPVPTDELHATLADWMDEFERAHLLLRLSARLRQRHGD